MIRQRGRLLSEPIQNYQKVSAIMPDTNESLSPKQSEPSANGESKLHDPVNHPKHYTAHPSGVECIQITEWMNFNLGNAVKYIWRAGEKGALLEDLKKARWYLDREIQRLSR